MPDYSQPGRDGSLPAGVAEWREGLGELTTRGLIYTARDARSVLPCDETYRITTAFKQKTPKGAPFAEYAELYQRVTRVAEARTSEMRCAHGEALHSRILGHLWSSIPGGSHDLPMAALVTELSCRAARLGDGAGKPPVAALAQPGGTPMEEFGRLAARPSNEFYNEYDMGDEVRGPAEPVCFSYGEHVESCSGVDYEPIVRRAEDGARFHYERLAEFPNGVGGPFTIFRRDWWAVPESLIVVVVYFQG